MNIVAIIQARCGSSRLPNKVLMDIAGEPMFSRVVQRVRQARTLTEVVLATSTDRRDEPLAALATRLGVRFWRGSENDVLNRFVDAANAFNADIVVRLTADCPLLDATVIDHIVQVFEEIEGLDYASNTLNCTYPDGLDVEVIRLDALIRAHLEARLPSEREHVTPYISKHPELFSLRNVTHTPDLSVYRLAVDEAVDLEVVRQIYQHFREPNFTFMDVIRFLVENPEVQQLNHNLERNEGYRRALQDDLHGTTQSPMSKPGHPSDG
jgi:spore coat polysaccharide biosynthesis protein SpsF (cytidylyltransferase family)